MPECHQCGNEAFFTCDHCENVFYCGSKCQKINYISHKLDCMLIEGKRKRKEEESQQRRNKKRRTENETLIEFIKNINTTITDQTLLDEDIKLKYNQVMEKILNKFENKDDKNMIPIIIDINDIIGIYNLIKNGNNSHIEFINLINKLILEKKIDLSKLFFNTIISKYLNEITSDNESKDRKEIINGFVGILTKTSRISDILGRDNEYTNNLFENLNNKTNNFIKTHFNNNNYTNIYPKDEKIFNNRDDFIILLYLGNEDKNIINPIEILNVKYLENIIQNYNKSTIPINIIEGLKKYLKEYKKSPQYPQYPRYIRRDLSILEILINSGEFIILYASNKHFLEIYNQYHSINYYIKYG